jgi:L-amino acid N-acyltransferase YncA
VTAYRLRLATASDAEAICRIYNQGIEDRVATLETELRTPDERRQWMAGRDARHPVIVAEFAEFIVAGTVRPPLTEGGLRQTRPGSVSADNHSGPADDRSGPADNCSGPADNRSGPADNRVASADSRSGPIGWASLNVFNARECYRFVADISVYVERGWRGKGVGRALIERLTELGRQHGFHKLVLSAFPSNSGGMALYTRAGFRPVGIYHEQGQLDGKWVDTIIMEKLLSV